MFVAGDIMTKQQSVVSAKATGQVAGKSAVLELSSEGFKSICQ